MRLKGLEPSRRKTPDPKSGASANSATSASGCKGNAFWANNQKNDGGIWKKDKTIVVGRHRFARKLKGQYHAIDYCPNSQTPNYCPNSQNYSFFPLLMRLAISPMKRPRHSTTSPVMIYSAHSPRPRNRMSPPWCFDDMPIKMPDSRETIAIDE